MDQYYRHFRNKKIYRLVDFATIEATEEEAVVYQAMYGERKLWIRPKASFFEQVEYEGKMVPRFQRISEREALKSDGNDFQYKLLAVLVAFWFPLTIAGPLGLVLYIIHLGESGNLFLILFIVTVLLYILAVILLSRYFIKGLYTKPDLSKVSDMTTTESGPAPSAAFFLGMLGGLFLNKSSRNDNNHW